MSSQMTVALLLNMLISGIALDYACSLLMLLRSSTDISDRALPEECSLFFTLVRTLLWKQQE